MTTMALPPPPRLMRCCKMTIDCFSEARKKLSAGKCILSDAVVGPGGHSWRIAFYPNGKLAGGTTDAVSIFLRMDCSDGKFCVITRDIHYTVEFRFVLYEAGGGGGAPRYTSDDYDGLFGRRAAKELGVEIVKLGALEKAGVLEHDCFTVACEFTILSASMGRPSKQHLPPPPPEPETSVVKVPSSGQPPSWPSELQGDLGRLLRTKEGADVQFEVCGEVFAAHKLVLAARSPVLKARFFGLTTEETVICNVLRVSDMDPRIFEDLLRYMYTDSVPLLMGGDGEAAATLALDMLVAAERYELQGLKSRAEDELCRFIDGGRVFRMLALAESYRCSKLKKMCLEFVGSAKNTNAIVVTGEDVEHLARRCPSVLNDVITKLLDASRSRDPTPLLDASRDPAATTPADDYDSLISSIDSLICDNLLYISVAMLAVVVLSFR